MSNIARGVRRRSIDETAPRSCRTSSTARTTNRSFRLCERGGALLGRPFRSGGTALPNGSPRKPSQPESFRQDSMRHRGGMMRGSVKIRLAGVLLCTLAAWRPRRAAIRRTMKVRPRRSLATSGRSDPKDFETLIGTGKAALEMGDAQAAAGFFARADEVNPRSPLPRPAWARCRSPMATRRRRCPISSGAQLGLPLSAFGCDRGLAYDVLGQQAQAQTDYRAALSGRDSDETRVSPSVAETATARCRRSRRSPRRQPRGRVRAFVLALTGDPIPAIRAINAVMPGQSAGVAPFIQRLPSLTAGQRAAAVRSGDCPRRRLLRRREQ